MLKGVRNHLTGYVEDHNMNDFAFDKEFYTFHNYGFAENPTGGDVVVSRNRDSNAPLGEGVFNKVKRDKKKRKPAGDPTSTESYLGPWAPYERAEEIVEEESTTEERKVVQTETAATQKKPRVEKEQLDAEGCTSIFHGKELKDYLGRSYVDPPTELKNVPHDAFLPKKWVHTWSGHTKAVAAARLFPKYGHLLLSAGMDNKVKVSEWYCLV